jgi:hypothetical protein
VATFGIFAAGVGIAGAGSHGGSVTITRDGTVLNGQEINGYVHVKANNVTIKNATVRYGGDHAVHISSGVVGTVIEATKIYCRADRTNGVVFGNYTARRVDLFGCENGFMYSDSAPATIIDSTWNGKAVTAGSDLGPAPASPVVPSPEVPLARPRPTAPSTVIPIQPPPGAGGIPVGFPGPDNTGVPAGTQLRPYGSLVAARDGQVISGLHINGCVIVTARNVVIRKSRITCGGLFSIRTVGAKNLLVEDVEIDGRGRNASAICCSDYTLRRVDIAHVIDGPRLADNTVVEGSWIHHLTRIPGSHNDTLQTTGASNIVVRGNSLDAYNPVTRDPLNACLMIGSTTAARVSNLIFEHNYCNGGNFSIGIRPDLHAANIRIHGNTYGRDCRYGIVMRPAHPGISWDGSTNVWLHNRIPVLR